MSLRWRPLRLAYPVLFGAVLLGAGRAAGQPIQESDLLVPVLVDAPGRFGSRFETEVALFNGAHVAIEVEAALIDGRGGPATFTFEIPPRSTRLFTSAELLSRLGTPGGAWPLRFRARNGFPASLAGASRVFNTLVRDGVAGTYGLALPVVAAGASTLGPGERVFLLGGTDAYPSRLNVALFAPFEASTVSLSTLDAIGVPLSTQTISLAPYERVQKNDVLATAPSPAKVEIRVLSGRVQTYGTVVANSPTNDAFRSPPIPRTATTPLWIVPGVAATPGRNGAVFSTDVYLFDSSTVQDFLFEIDVTFRPYGGRDSSARSTRVTLVPGTIRVLTDVLRTLFPSAVPEAGTAGVLELRSPISFEAFAVTRTESPAGPSSQDLACVPEAGEITNASPALFVGLAESTGARSNLVLANRGPATTVAVSLFTEEGPQGEVLVPLEPGEATQLNSVVRRFSNRPTGAAALLLRPALGGRIVASASRIDNVSNDPAALVAGPALSVP